MRTRYILLPILGIAIANVACAQGNQYDSRIDSYVGLRYPCDGTVQPVLRIQNVGGETMTSCDIDILKNGVTDNTFNWVLGVPAATGEFRQPALPGISGVLPGDELEFRILTVNGQADQGVTENILTVPMTDEKGDAASYQVQVRVLTDDNPGETSWRVKDALGATVAQSPIYAAAGTLTETPVTLVADQCYNFEVYDSGADGFGESRELGYAKLVSLGEDVAVATGAFGALYRKVAQTGTENGCMPSQLTTTVDPAISCGAQNLQLGSSSIHATAVPGADRYMFRFTNIVGQPAYARNISVAGRSLPLVNWSTLPLKRGRTYNVQVRASFDDGASYCAYGSSCTIRIGYGTSMMLRDAVACEELIDAPVFSMWPNPTEDGNITLKLDGYDAEEPLVVEAFDLRGARISSSMTAVPDDAGVLRVRWSSPLASGLYAVRVSHAGLSATERLVVR